MAFKGVEGVRPDSDALATPRNLQHDLREFDLRKRVRLRVYFGVTVLFMCRTLYQMFVGVRPFDWIMLAVEVAVLLLILYEVIIGEKRHREATNRLYRRTMAKAKLGEMHAKGTALIWKFGRDANVNHYAHEWIEETKTVMREYLDESYISRFDVLVSRAQNDVIQPIEITERLKELKGFIQELQVSS